MSQDDPVGKPPILAVFEHFGYALPAIMRDGWAKVRCPLHEDRNASATINIELNRWKCHVCDINEDSIDVIMRERGLAFADARRIAAEEFGGSGSPLPPISGTRSGIRRKSLWAE